MPTCKVNNVELYYEVNGEGRPIVFTHGASWNHKQWDAQVEFFSKNYQTIVWDVRGHGNSTLPEEEDFDSEDFSRDLIGLLDHLQIDQAILCGLSMGGHISLQTAIRYPERVSALVVIGTPFTNTFDWLEKLFIPLNRWSHQFIPMSYVANFQASILSTSNNVTKRYIEEAVSSMSHKNWLRIWNAVTSMESGEDLGKIDCPTLILQGEHDSMIKRQQHYMNKCIKKSKFLIVEDANHATNLDNPTEVNQLMDQFLQLSGTT